MKAQFSGFIENVSLKMNRFILSAAQNMKLLIFPIDTPSCKTKMKQMSHTNKKNINGKLQNQQAIFVVVVHVQVA